jgi:hypothetical protein
MIFGHAGISTSLISSQLRNSEARKREKRGEVCLGEADCAFSGSLDRRWARYEMCNGQISVWPKEGER